MTLPPLDLSENQKPEPGHDAWVREQVEQARAEARDPGTVLIEDDEMAKWMDEVESRLVSAIELKKRRSRA